jgi:peptide deformylase
VIKAPAPSPVVQAGHPVLRAAAELVDPAHLGSEEMRALVQTMVAVMRAAPGVGLAAPQIGVGLQVIVLEDAEALMAKLTPAERAARGRVPYPLQVLVNPKLTPIGDERATFFEGCLSVKGYMALVERAIEVEISGLDEHGKEVSFRVSGWPARILQHEVDHLRGTLYVDRMLTRTFCCNEEASRWIGLPASETRDKLGAG